MSSIIKFHGISGAEGESPPCYILQIDDFRFLLDCGWNEQFDMEFIANLKKFTHKIDCVLLSHSDTYHLGALPYLVGKCGLSCPIYATIPVFKMGQMFCYDLYLNRHNSQEFDKFNLDDVDSAFDNILQLEYNRSVPLQGRGKGITITALPAGRSLGGTTWKISKTGEEDIYYAIDHNNKKERHLNGFEYEKIQRPGIFITNAFNAMYVQEKRRKRDDTLLGVMQQTLRAGGNVLVATDTAGRALELVLMIDQMSRMKDSGLSQYSLVFFNNVAFNVIEFSKSLLEWMSEKLIKSFETTKNNPFQLKNVVVCHSLIELSQIPSPKVVISSGADLECGFTRDLFLQWCQDPRSSIVLTNRTSPGTLARTLIDGITRGTKMDLEVRQRIRLEGKELEEFIEKRNDRKRKVDVIAVEDSSDDEPEIVFARNVNNKRNAAANNNTEVDSGGIKLNNNNHPAFPTNSQKRRRFDDYGEVVRAEDFKENGKFSKEKSKKRSMLSSSCSESENDPPTKTVAFTQTFSINCQVLFIDFEGRSDVESLLKMIQEMQPSNVVLVRGTTQSTNALEILVQKLIPGTKIIKPYLQHVVNLTNTNAQIFQVKLTDSIMSSLKFDTVRDYEVAWIDGELVESKSSEDDLLQSGPNLEPLPANAILPHQPLVVNKLRISELRQIFAKNGIESKVEGGVLHCTCKNGAVYIQKDSETRSIHIECDGLPEEYYKIRSLVYEQLAMI